MSFYGTELSGTIPPSIGGLVKLTSIYFSYTGLSGTAPVALLKLCQSTSAGGGGASCSTSGLKLLLPSNMSGLVDLTELDLSSWGIEGAHLLKANVYHVLAVQHDHRVQYDSNLVTTMCLPMFRNTAQQHR